VTSTTKQMQLIPIGIFPKVNAQNKTKTLCPNASLRCEILIFRLLLCTYVWRLEIARFTLHHSVYCRLPEHYLTVTASDTVSNSVYRSTHSKKIFKTRKF